MITVLIAVFPHLMAVFVVAVTISISIAGTSVIVCPAVIAVMIICVTAVGCIALILAEARVLAETGFILASPLPIFLLALTVQPVVLT